MQKQNKTMTQNAGAKSIGKTRERAVVWGNQCRGGVVGQGLHPCREGHPTSAQVPKVGLSACRVSAMGKEYVTLLPHYEDLLAWHTIPKRREAKHLARHFCFVFVASSWSCGRSSIRFEPVAALTWLSDT